MSQDALACRERGSGQEPALLLLHGGGASSRMWERELHTYSAYHCLAPDLPGHGESAHIQPFTLEMSIVGLAALIRERVAGGRVCLLAVSLGVPIALALCDRHPALVDRLFLSGPTPRLGRFINGLTELAMRPLLRWGSTSLRTRMAARSMGLSEEQIAPMRKDFEQLTIGLVRDINAVAANQGEPAPLPHPALVIAGAREAGLVKKQACAIVRALPGAKGYLAPDTGHAWMYERPDLFDATVRAWMQGAPPPPQLQPLPC